MNNKFSVVMYHYVRDLKNTRYPAIKGLNLQLFREQLKYLKRHYNFVTANQLVDAFQNGTELPKKSIVLTFDDAYSDHFINVFPAVSYYHRLFKGMNTISLDHRRKMTFVEEKDNKGGT